MLAQAGNEANFDLMRALLRIGILEEAFEHLRIEHQRLEIIAHGLDVDVLVDELDSLRTERMPQQLAAREKTLGQECLRHVIDIRLIK